MAAGRLARGLFASQNTEDLDSLYQSMFGQVVLGMYILAWLAVLQALYGKRMESLWVAAVILVGASGASRLAKVNFRLARYWLIAALLAAVAGETWLFPQGLVRHFFPVVVVVSGLFVAPPAMFLVAGLAAGLYTWVMLQQGAPGLERQEIVYPVVLIFATTFATWLVAQQARLALDWLQSSYTQASELLKQLRQERAILARTLRDLEHAYSQIEKMNAVLVEARSTADKARQMKEQFAANISHELRTPLNLILGFSEVMYLSSEVYGELEWPAALRQDIYQIYRNSRHLLEMIDDILDLSRFEMTGFTLNKEPTPLVGLLQETGEIARDLFRGQAVRLVLELDPELPTLELDRVRIRQVLLNLINNARRFTTEGSVTLAAVCTPANVQVTVRDTGQGIPLAEQEHIFDEFYQVDRSLARAHGGAGLGLAICKRFIEAHDGRIWVESREGEGSSFSFSLPLPAFPAYIFSSAPLEEKARRAPLVVVDPDPGVAALVKRHLQDYEVISLASVFAIPQAVSQHHPRAVVVNVQPDSERPGPELLPEAVPLLECSLPSKTWLARNLAVAACLTKPVMAEQLLAAIEGVGQVGDILVIDDDRDFCQLIERMLAASGRPYTVRRGIGGERGLAQMRAQRPDLVLLDLVMPGFSGLQVLETMQQDPGLAGLAVVLLTGTLHEEAAGYQRGQISVQRLGGFYPAEVLRSLKALIAALEPRYPGEPNDEP